MTARYECVDPLVVGRVASVPIERALELLAAADPLEATRAFYAESAFARAAVAVASPSLASAIDEWIAGQKPRNAKTPLRALSYALRMAARCTPFGLFAGVGVVETGAVTSLELDETPGAHRTCTRPDMELIATFVRSVEIGELRDRVAFVTNDCAFVRGDRLFVTHVELGNFRTQAQGGFGTVEQRDVSLRHTGAVAFVRESCAAGLPYGEAIAALVERFGATDVESRRLLNLLIEAGVIISELRASPLGDPIAYVLERLEAIGAPQAAGLRRALAEAAQLDETPVAEQTAAAHRRVASAFVEATGPVTGAAVQIDLRTAFRGALGSQVLADAALLADLSMRSGRVFRMQNYRDRFVERYEGSDRMVPLLELVDNAIGLGNPEESVYDRGDDGAREDALLQLFSEAARANAPEIVMDAAMLETIFPQAGRGSTPRSLEIGFELAAPSYPDLVRGDYRMVSSLFSSRAGKTVTRFASMLGDEALAKIQRVTDRALMPGELAAEFSYAPIASRAYNVCIRPKLYAHEVRAGIGAPPNGESLSPSDLWVGIDGDRFYLWSKSRACRVSVRETHALMTAIGAPNLCRFLALVQADGERAPEFDLGIADRLTYRPRLRYGRVVVARRRWQLPRAAFGSGVPAAAAALDGLRARWNLPRFTFLCAGDNRLLLDLDSQVAPALLEAQLAERAVEFEEALPSPDEMWLRGNSGRHAAEFVVQLSAVDPPVESRPAAKPVVVPNRVRHGPGSEWTYVKLYLGAQAADDFVVGALLPLVRELREQGAIDRWFFLRYSDPGHHLRVRFHATQARFAAPLLERVAGAAQGWLRDERVSKYSLDTYDPEYERYGGPQALADAEWFFSYDSDLCAASIAGGAGNTGARIEAAAATFDALLQSSADLSQLALDAYDGFAGTKLSARDRESLRRIAASTAPAQDGALLEAALEGPGRKKRLLSLVHMHCNRLGLDGEAEDRVGLLLRALALARFARASRLREEPLEKGLMLVGVALPEADHDRVERGHDVQGLAAGAARVEQIGGRSGGTQPPA